jgi:hypothetical protein
VPAPRLLDLGEVEAVARAEEAEEGVVVGIGLLAVLPAWDRFVLGVDVVATGELVDLGLVIAAWAVLLKMAAGHVVVGGEGQDAVVLLPEVELVGGGVAAFPEFICHLVDGVLASDFAGPVVMDCLVPFVPEALRRDRGLEEAGFRGGREFRALEYVDHCLGMGGEGLLRVSSAMIMGARP